MQTETKTQQTTDEAVWVAKATQGDQHAFSEIVRLYQRPIYNLCYRMLGNTGEAEDAAQEVFVKAFFKLDSYDPKRKFSSWLFAIGSHYCIDRLRKRKVQMVSWDDLPPWRWLPDEKTPQPEEAILDAEKTAEIHQLLDSLPADYRAAVVLKYWHNLSYDDIAAQQNTTVSAIKSKLFRARKMMAKTAKQQQSTAFDPIPSKAAV